MSIGSQVTRIYELRERTTLDFIQSVRKVADEDKLEIDASGVEGIYPDGAVSFAAAYQYFRAKGVAVTGSSQLRV